MNFNKFFSDGEKKLEKLISAAKKLKWEDVRKWFKRNAVYLAFGFLISQVVIRNHVWWEYPILVACCFVMAILLIWHSEEVNKPREKIIFEMGYLQCKKDEIEEVQKVISALSKAAESFKEEKLKNLN